jgi:hypothetical protein
VQSERCVVKSVRGGKRRTTVGVPSRSRFSSNGSSECGLLGTHTIFLLGSSCTQVKPATRRPSSCLHNVLCRKRCSTQHNGIDVSGTQMRSNPHERQPRGVCVVLPDQAATLPQHRGQSPGSWPRPLHLPACIVSDSKIWLPFLHPCTPLGSLPPHNRGECRPGASR